MAPLAKFAAAYGEEVQVLVGLDIGTLWDRMKGEFLNEFARVESAKLPVDEMERQMMGFIDGLSPKFEEDLARKTSGVAYNSGRDAAIRTARAKGEAMYVVRSEVLDAATCTSCAGLDGSVMEIGTAEYERMRPPYGCEGGNRCRGFYVAIGEGM